MSGVPITMDVLLPLLPLVLQPLVREAWDDVLRGVPLVLTALESECAPDLVRVVVLGPGASMALRLPR